MTNEECVRSQDMGNYYRVLPDGRDLNYDKFFVDGNEKLSFEEEYNSHNTERLNIEQIKEKLLSLSYVRNELKGWEGK